LLDVASFSIVSESDSWVSWQFDSGTREPFHFIEPMSADFKAGPKAQVAIRLSFFGHYNEPDTVVCYSFVLLTLTYDHSY
jgi:hypothetical protein